METNLIISPDNLKIKELRKLASSSRERERTSLCFCEGDTLYNDAVDSGAEIVRVFIRSGSEINVSGSAEVYHISSRLFDSLSQVETPQNVIFLCGIKTKTFGFDRPSIILDGLSDPGNLGTVIRSADAFEIPVVLGNGCADAYSPKTVRATMGAIFRTLTVRCSCEEAVKKFAENEIKTYAAALGPDSISIGNVLTEKASYVIGNEAKGVSEDVISACNGKIIIPMKGKCESLNAAVAASIIMYEMSK